MPPVLSENRQDMSKQNVPIKNEVAINRKNKSGIAYE